MLAIMIVTYNRLELTKQTISSLFETVDYPFRLVFVDNNSTDETVEYLKSLELMVDRVDNFKGMSLRINKENQGIAIGRNQGLVDANKTDATWYATLDNDVLLPKGWASECIDILTKCPMYAKIGVNFEGKKYPEITLNGKTFQTKRQGNLGTACMVFNKKIHKLIGFFNHLDYKYYGHEDADYSSRIKSLGLQIGYIKSNGTHIGEDGDNGGEYREFKNEYHAKNLAKFYENSRLYMAKKKSVYIHFEDK